MNSRKSSGFQSRSSLVSYSNKINVKIINFLIYVFFLRTFYLFRKRKRAFLAVYEVLKGTKFQYQRDKISEIKGTKFPNKKDNLFLCPYDML